MAKRCILYNIMATNVKSLTKKDEMLIET